MNKLLKTLLCMRDDANNDFKQGKNKEYFSGRIIALNDIIALLDTIK